MTDDWAFLNEEIKELKSENASLREAIRRLADQDATLSLLCKRDGSQVITVTTDATLTPAEMDAVSVAVQCVEAARAQKHPEQDESRYMLYKAANTLLGLLERLK